MSDVVDMIGKRFGKLTVISKYQGEKKRRGAYWVCRCDCGNEHITLGQSLRRGSVTSCGCNRVENASQLIGHRWGQEHQTKTYKENKRLYNVWVVMRERCNNPKWPQFKDYGGRGIKVCDEWETFRPFMEWAYSHGYDKNAKRGECTIDRIDNDQGYSPSNCRWVPQSVQIKNRRPRSKKEA